MAFYFNPQTDKTCIEPRLVFIDDSIADDQEVKVIIDQWVQKVFDAFREQRFDLGEIVTSVPEGLEASVRNQ